MEVMDPGEWGEAEKLQRWVGRRILGVGKRVADAVVQGELGLLSMKGRRMLLRLTYWSKILKMDKGRLVRRVYEAGRTAHAANKAVKNWASRTHQWLGELGLEECWKKQEIAEDWQDTVRAKISELEERDWTAGMTSKPKIARYRTWKKTLGREAYLDERENEQGRRSLTKCRGGALELRVETGRWETMRVRGAVVKLQRHQRICEVCFRGVEDEMHFVMRCPAYTADRNVVLAKAARGMGFGAQLAGKIVAGQYKGGNNAAEEELLTWALNGEGQKLAMRFLRSAVRRRKQILEEF